MSDPTTATPLVLALGPAPTPFAVEVAEALAELHLDEGPRTAAALARILRAHEGVRRTEALAQQRPPRTLEDVKDQTGAANASEAIAVEPDLPQPRVQP